MVKMNQLQSTLKNLQSLFEFLQLSFQSYSHFQGKDNVNVDCKNSKSNCNFEKSTVHFYNPL